MEAGERKTERGRTLTQLACVSLSVCVWGGEGVKPPRACIRLFLVEGVTREKRMEQAPTSPARRERERERGGGVPKRERIHTSQQSRFSDSDYNAFFPGR